MNKLMPKQIVAIFMCIIGSFAQAQNQDGSDIVPFVKSNFIPLIDKKFGTLYQDCSKVQSEKGSVERLIQVFSADQDRRDWCKKLIDKGYANPAFRSIFYGDCEKIVTQVVSDKSREMKERVYACERNIEEEKRQKAMQVEREQQEVRRQEMARAQEKARAEEAERMKDPVYRAKKLKQQEIAARERACFDSCTSSDAVVQCYLTYRNNELCGKVVSECVKTCNAK